VYDDFCLSSRQRRDEGDCGLLSLRGEFRFHSKGDRHHDGFRLVKEKDRNGPKRPLFDYTLAFIEVERTSGGKPRTGAIVGTMTACVQESHPQHVAPEAANPWAAKSLRLFRQTLINVLADCGSEQRPWPDGPIVRAVDIELVREEFYKSYPAIGDAKDKASARRKAFGRAVTDAQAKSLIGTRDIGVTTCVWLVAPTPAHGGTGNDQS
jgi:hypothetical protein